MSRYFIFIFSFSLISTYILYQQNLSPSSKYSLKSFSPLLLMIPSLAKHHFICITYIYELTTPFDPFNNQNILFKNCIQSYHFGAWNTSIPQCSFALGFHFHVRILTFMLSLNWASSDLDNFFFLYIQCHHDQCCVYLEALTIIQYY